MGPSAIALVDLIDVDLMNLPFMNLMGREAINLGGLHTVNALTLATVISSGNTFFSYNLV